MMANKSLEATAASYFVFDGFLRFAARWIRRGAVLGGSVRVRLHRAHREIVSPILGDNEATAALRV